MLSKTPANTFLLMFEVWQLQGVDVTTVYQV